MHARTPLLLAAVTTALVVSVALLAGPAGHHVVRRDAAVQVSAPVPCTTRALAVLRRWDRRRAEVWAAGDPSSLSGLYVAGSRTAQRDVAMLTAYRSHRLRVRSMRRQVLSLRVRSCAPRRLSLVVTDRLVGAVAAGHGSRTGLPPGRPTTRRLDLRRDGRGWRVSEVYER